MMTQTLALLVDAYRELQSKKMFWIVLILNIVVVGGFALLGVNDHTITILWFEPLGNMKATGVNPLYIYKGLFSTGIVGFWFTWLATLLALVSTAGIFPDFLTSGSVDLFLAKPISRSRLFFTKYVAGLLFVLLQVSVFTLLSFLVLGLRASVWEAGLFAAIPLVLLFYSYLFSICALLGVWTRSTVAALLLTLLAWFGIWAMDLGERTATGLNDAQTLIAANLDDQIDAANTAIAAAQTAPVSATAASQSAEAATRSTMPADDVDVLTRHRDDLVQQRKDTAYSPALAVAQKVIYGVKTVVPKTRETMNLLDRVLFSDKDLQEAVKPADDAPQNAMPTRGFRPGRRVQERQLEVMKRERQRPVWWIVGTSLLFEAVLLALAAWHFCTRDF